MRFSETLAGASGLKLRHISPTMEMTMTTFYFASDESGLILIDATTQAEAEAKLLAEPSLIGVSNIRDFAISFRSFRPSFRATVPDRYAPARSDKIIPWSSVIQIILAYKGRA